MARPMRIRSRANTFRSTFRCVCRCIFSLCIFLPSLHIPHIFLQAHWCPPCRGFTPKLAQAYKAAKAANKPWEVVFVSADNSEEEFAEYYETMPWLSLPHEDPRCAFLNSHFEVEGIPSLVLVAPDGKVLSTELRGASEEDPEAADFPWPRKAVTSLRSSVGSINDEPVLVVLTDGSPEQVASARAAVGVTAEAELARGSDARLRFAVSDAEEEDRAVRDKLLGLVGQSGASLPVAVLFVVPAGKRYDIAADQITADDIASIVAQFGAKTLALVDLR